MGGLFIAMMGGPSQRHEERRNLERSTCKLW